MTRIILSLRSSLRRSFLILLGCIIAQGPVQAELTHYVPFDTGYTTFADLHMSGGSDLGFGANTWFDGAEPFMGSFVGEGSLNGPSGLPVAGQHAQTPPTGFNLAFYTFDVDEEASLGKRKIACKPASIGLVLSPVPIAPPISPAYR